MKNKKPTKIVALDNKPGTDERLAFPVAVSEDGTPPSEFLLFKAGANLTTKGTFTFSKASAQSVMADYEKRGIERHGDWEHASLSSPAELADGGAPASCWYELALRDGNLWAVNVRWTPKAAEQLKNKEYRYYSTVFVHTEDGEIQKFLNLGITNDPAMCNQAPLVAATARMKAMTKDSSMDKIKEACAALMAAFESGDEEAQKAAALACAQALFDAGFDEPQGEELADDEKAPEDKAEDKKEMSEGEPDGDEKKALRALTGKSGTAAVATMTAWKDAASQVEALSARLAKIEAEKASTDFDGVIAAGKRDGKLSPAMLSDSSKGAGKYIAACRKNKDVAALSAYVEALPKIVNTEETPAPKSGVVALSDLDLEVAKKLGIDPEKLRASKAQ